MKGYILVWTSFSAFASERILKNIEDFYIKLVPTPREFSSDCGIAVYFEIPPQKSTLLTQKLDEKHIEYEIKYLQN